MNASEEFLTKHKLVAFWICVCIAVVIVNRVNAAGML
jgi:hypothetical protein